MDDQRPYLWLKILTIVGPTAYVAGGEIFRTYYLTRHFSPTTVSALAVGTTLVGAIIFSWYVFRAIERLETERRTFKEALLSLKERERIAREMHDGVAQNLAVLKIEAYKLKDFVHHHDESGLRQEIEVLEALLNQTYLEVRQTLYDLRASQRLDEGFWPIIERQAKEFERTTNIRVIVQPLSPPDELWSDLASVQILRIIQEALANVRQHAQARRVDVRCIRQERVVEFIIADDGVGFAMEGREGSTDHYGLEVMRERAEAIGGKLDIESHLGDGTTVRILVPIDGRGMDGGKGKTHVGG